MTVSVPENPKHLLVDGSNVGRAWPDAAALWKRQPEAARQRVVERARIWHDAMGWRVTVVFDGRGPEVSIEQPSGEATLVVAYSPRRATADTVIEQWVARSRDPATCVVATGDGGLAATVRVAGGEVITPADLAAWIRRAEESTRRRVTGNRNGGGGAR